MFWQPLADSLQIPDEEPRRVNIEIGRPKSDNPTRSLERNVMEPFASVPDVRDKMGLPTFVNDFQPVVATRRNNVVSAALSKPIGSND